MYNQNIKSMSTDSSSMNSHPIREVETAEAGKNMTYIWKNHYKA